MIYTYVLSNGEVLVPCEFSALTALSLGSHCAATVLAHSESTVRAQ